MKLLERILSEENIFLAIYLAKSYILNRELLNEADWLLLYKTEDVFDEKTISELMSEVKNRIIHIMEHADDFFEVSVYFKPKDYDADRDLTEFRPLHTASLVDQICMVAMLQVLIYTIDEDGRIQPSELSRLLPESFYGNKVCFNGEYLFMPWKEQYHQYSEKVTTAFYEYSRSREYQYEVDLDLKNFFPSIHPAVMEKLLMEQCPMNFEQYDRDTFQKIVRKLLVFKLLPNKPMDETEKGWYLRDEITTKKEILFVKGIPQGLPHAYFFANIFMISVRKIYEAAFPGKMFFYVDDSVIFTKIDLDEEIMNRKIEAINQELYKLSQPKDDSFFRSIDGWAYNKEDFIVSVHGLDHKTSFAKIENDPKDFGTRYLGGICREASTVGFDIYASWSEDELKTLHARQEALKEAIEREIEEQKNRETESAEMNAAYLKRLYRYRKFFANRLMMLDFKNSETKNAINHTGFFQTLKEKDNAAVKPWFFENLNENNLETVMSFIFRKSYLTGIKVDELEEQYHRLEKILYEGRDQCSYLRKAFESYSWHYDGDLYDSLRSCMKLFARQMQYKTEKKRLEWFQEKILKHLSTDASGLNERVYKELLKNSTLYRISRIVRSTTHQMDRRVLNAAYSAIFDYTVNDSFLFSKVTRRPMQYGELRILSVLRSRFWRPELFLEIFQKASEEEYQRDADYSILQVLHIFHTFVVKPEWVDKLILTHQYCSDTWKNGSKHLYFYTLHNQEHAIELIKRSVQLMNIISSLEIKQVECFILFAACYLHDISMVSLPEYKDFYINENADADKIFNEFSEKYKKSEDKHSLLDAYQEMDAYFEDAVRNPHHINSANEIRKHQELAFFDQPMRDLIAEVSEAHGLEGENVYLDQKKPEKDNGVESEDGKKQLNSKPIINLKTTKLLLRLADLLDISSYRVSKLLLKHNLENMGEESRFHWLCHLLTEKCRIFAEYEPVRGKKGKYICKDRIKEKIIFEIGLLLEQSTPLKGWECKGVSSCDFAGGTRGKIYEIKVGVGEIHTLSECPFFCKCFCMKNHYIAEELAWLQKYLTDMPDNFFTSEIVLRLVPGGNRDFPAEMYEYLREYMNNKEKNKEG